VKESKMEEDMGMVWRKMKNIRQLRKKVYGKGKE
jgi:hypothetical protein